jgi:hypothetical protein
MTKLGSGEIQFQGCLLGHAVAVCICPHTPQHVPNRDDILAYLNKQGVDLEADFSLVLDANGHQDVLLVFGNRKTLSTFGGLVDELRMEGWSR